MNPDAARMAAALPKYDIGNEIGRGAWGVVLAAEHRQLGRGVAIKQLPRAFAADPMIQRRFAAEARLLASLDHPHIVPIFDYVEEDGLCLLVMELLPQGTVRDRFVTEGIRPDAACSIVLATCSALHYAHAKGILHRDIKPENLLFNGSGTLKVTDFGIAKVLGGAETLATKTGDVLGTPAYMAPEQVTGKALTPATDVYAVATMLYELLSGQLPFSDEGGLITALFRHVYEAPTPLLEVAPIIPGALARVVMRGLTTDPEERHPSAEDFGVAVAEAANEAWGPGWLSATELDVMASKRVAQRISDPLGRSVDGAARVGETASPADPAVGPGAADPGDGAKATRGGELSPVVPAVGAEAADPGDGAKATRELTPADVVGLGDLMRDRLATAPGSPAAVVPDVEGPAEARPAGDAQPAGALRSNGDVLPAGVAPAGPAGELALAGPARDVPLAGGEPEGSEAALAPGSFAGSDPASAGGARPAAGATAPPRGPQPAGAAASPVLGPNTRTADKKRRRVIVALLSVAIIGVAATLALARNTSGTGDGTPGGGATTAVSPSTSPSTKSTVVFADDFSDRTSGWAPDAGQEGAGSAEYRSDGYYVTGLKPLPVLNTFSLASPYAPKLAFMSVSAAITFVTAAPSDGAGVRCDQGGRNGLRYTFEIGRDGTWAIFRIDPGSVVLLSGTSPTVRTGGGQNTVEGRCTEVAGGATKLAMTVNGVDLGTTTDTHTPGDVAWHGALVVYRSTADPATVVRFNSFRTAALNPG